MKKNIKNIITNQKNNHLKWVLRNMKYILPIVFIIIIFFIPDISHAATSEVEATNNLKNMMAKMGIIAKTLWSFFMPLMLMVGALMNNDAIFGGNMGTTLHLIWLEMRDIVNILFVVVLVVVAIYNVFGFGKDSDWSIKNALPKIALALIVINFTYFAARLALDVINVGTVATFSIATDLSDGNMTRVKTGHSLCKTFTWQKDEVDYKLKHKTNLKLDKETKQKLKKEQETLKKKLKRCVTYTKNRFKLEDADVIKQLGVTKIDEVKVFEKGAKYTDIILGNFDNPADTTEVGITSENFALIIIGSMGNLLSVNDLHHDAKNFEKLTINTIFSVLVTLVFGIGILLLFIILLARVVFLWVLIALSPLIGLKLVFPNMNLGGGGGDIKDTAVKTAIAPMIIGFWFSIGFIMINAWVAVSDFSSTSLENLTKAESINAVSKDFLVNGVSTFDDYFIMIAILIIIWKGVTSAADGTIASSITKSITNTVESAAKSVAKAPLYAPIFKTDKGNLSVMGALRTGEKVFQDYENRGQRTYNELKNSAYSDDIYKFRNKSGRVTADDAKKYALAENKNARKAFDHRMMQQITNTKRKKEYEEAMKKAGGKPYERHQVLQEKLWGNNDEGIQKLTQAEMEKGAKAHKDKLSSGSSASSSTSSSAASSAAGSTSGAGGVIKPLIAAGAISGAAFVKLKDKTIDELDIAEGKEKTEMKKGVKTFLKKHGLDESITDDRQRTAQALRRVYEDTTQSDVNREEARKLLDENFSTESANRDFKARVRSSGGVGGKAFAEVTVGAKKGDKGHDSAKTVKVEMDPESKKVSIKGQKQIVTAANDVAQALKNVEGKAAGSEERKAAIKKVNKAVGEFHKTWKQHQDGDQQKQAAKKILEKVVEKQGGLDAAEGVEVQGAIDQGTITALNQPTNTGEDHEGPQHPPPGYSPPGGQSVA